MSFTVTGTTLTPNSSYTNISDIIKGTRLLTHDLDYKILVKDDFLLERLQDAYDWVVAQTQPFDMLFVITGDGITEAWQLPFETLAVRGVYIQGQQWVTSELTLESNNQMPYMSYDDYQAWKATVTQSLSSILGSDTYTILAPNQILIYPLSSGRVYTVRYIGSQKLVLDGGLYLPRILGAAMKYKAASDLILHGYYDRSYVDVKASEIDMIQATNSIQVYKDLMNGVGDSNRVKLPQKGSPYF